MGALSDPLWLTYGEVSQMSDSSIGYISPIGHFTGRGTVTNYRFHFSGVEKYAKDSPKNCEFSILLGNVLHIAKAGAATNNAEPYGLILTTKDNNCIRIICDAANHARRALFDSLYKNAFPLLHHKAYFSGGGLARKSVDGWNVYNPHKEFERLKIPNESWEVIDLNSNYDISDTYPRVLAIPTAAAQKGRDFIRKVAEYRSKHRMAVLSWLDPHTQASITRCAQPLSGMTNRRCAEDELYMKMILSCNQQGHQLLLLDARPEVNANVNRAKGGGVEPTYDRCALHFLNIHNIHVVRESLRLLHAALFPKVEDRNYQRLVEESRWLTHIQSIAAGSRMIVDAICRERCSVLVHCSDGWDRTSQLTSLAMIQLDGYYRTIEGFAVLIEKEWCSFGHKFGHRCGHGIDASKDNERSPIFVQFIDCVWQMMQQFSCRFEFTSQLLLCILDELYSCRFGTFLYNSEKERLRDNQCASRTVSLWTYVMSSKQSFRNPLYHPTENPLLVNTSFKVLRIWTEYHARHNVHVIGPQAQVGGGATLMSVQDIRRTSLARANGKLALLEQLVNSGEILTNCKV